MKTKHSSEPAPAKFDGASDLRQIHDQINLVIGLASLMHLQYTQEGHIDQHVHELFMQILVKAEEKLNRGTWEEVLTDLPF